ncbi:DinB family protein [Mucilaginibacter sp. KACC 22063]|uniref:DinB family protein n=1 Tax=Mucilaginibacter sp. KACC 22063 TaxID=3025666 RepID=UPI002365C6DB|nr:DinB family protein [Mucilaginibacter sp. KACC 22063]WDF57031.1 DinB family protein [Mucilaginibacter sp. KACC 22063]
MYRHIQDFLNDWKTQESNTVKIFSSITEETKSQKINENVRSLERLAWHIIHTITEMGAQAGLFESDLLADYAVPSTFSEIITVYQQYNALLGQAVRSKWTDSSLEDVIPMYGQQWKKGELLSVFVGHETHHRSQMTVIMRVLGLPVPGLFGPSKEEWALMGLPAME